MAIVSFRFLLANFKLRWLEILMLWHRWHNSNEQARARALVCDAGECAWVCASVCLHFICAIIAIVLCICALNERKFQHWPYIRTGGKYWCCATNQHPLLIAKLIVMIMIINTIFVSGWHFAIATRCHLCTMWAERKRKRKRKRARERTDQNETE